MTPGESSHLTMIAVSLAGSAAAATRQISSACRMATWAVFRPYRCRAR